MTPPAPADIVATWEAGAGQPNWQRALTALAPILPDASPDALAALSIGTRNAHLLTLREALAGAVLHAVVICPQCGEALEFDQEIGELLGGYQAPAEPEFTVSDGALSARYRLLTSNDLAAAAAAGEQVSAREALVSGALLEATRDGKPLSGADAPPDLIRRVGEDMAERDPLADISIPLACAACEHVWPASIDIVPLVWTEVERQAQAILADVVRIASAYGWSEADILAMSAARRHYYLDAIE